MSTAYPARADARPLPKTTHRRGWAPRLRRLPIYLGAAVLLLVALAPLYWVFVSSISTRIELYAVPYKHWIPEQPTLENYRNVLTTGPKYRAGGYLPAAEAFWNSIRNSLILAGASAAILTALSTLAGYAFSRLDFRGKQLLFTLMILFIPLPIWVSLIALYFLVSRLNLVDTLGGLTLIFVAYGVPLYVWLMKTFIDATPKAIEEAAIVDGCSKLRALFAVTLPVVRPGLTSVFLVAFLTTWNNFLIPLIFSSTSQSQPMTVVIAQFIGQYEVAWEAMSAAAVLTILPPVLLAIFFQRYLVRGLSLGAVQG